VTLSARCADAIMAVLFAPLCATCHDPLDMPVQGAVCARCRSRIQLLTEPLCATCGDTLASWRSDGGTASQCVRCRRTPRVITRGRAVGAYEGVLREMLHALKYDGRRSIARPLGRLMRQAGDTILEDADFVVPVPLHAFRLYRRGFNQAAELAAHVEIPHLAALRRRRATATQTDLPEAERHRNVRDAFAVRRSARSAVSESVVVLIDDVSTTGATLDACAAALLAAGAKEVRALTAARAVSRLP
jgi:ComF family protein